MYICSMRTLAHLSVLALLWAGVAKAGDDKASKMTLKVEKAQVATAQKALSSLKGVKSVKYDEAQGQLIILYDKPTLGCCSRIHSALKEAGVQYTLVSNEEYPACKDKHEHGEEHSDAAPTAPVQKTSTKKAKKGCCSGAKKTSSCAKAS